MSSVRFRFAPEVLLLTALLVACGQPQDAAAPVPVDTPAVDPSCRGIPDGAGTVNWDNPVPGSEASSLSAATQQIAFEPRTPSDFDSPIKVLVVPPANEADIAIRGLMILYDKQPYGRVIVSMSRYDGPPDFAKWAKDTAVLSESVPCGPTSEATNIRNGVPALLGHPIDKSHWSIRWVEGKIEFNILGPKLGREDVIEIANGPWS